MGPTPTGQPTPSPRRPNEAMFRRFVGSAFRSLSAGQAKGHTYMPISEISGQMAGDLGINTRAVVDGFRRLDALQHTPAGYEQLLAETRAGEIYIDLQKHRLIGHDAVMAEMSIANAIHDLNMRPRLDRAPFLITETRRGIALSRDQIEAVDKGLTHPFLVITGGAGVGKTTVMGCVADASKAIGKKVVLAAPTGAAAKRLSFATGHPAQTIHRLLKYAPDGKGGFQPTVDYIDADVLIIDEASMLDVWLGAALFKRIDRQRTRVIMVGDPNQLPSVGPGEILRDLLSALFIPRVSLSRSHRQEGDSPIEEMATAVLDRRLPDWEKLKATGRIALIDCENAADQIATYAYEWGLARDPFPKHRWESIDRRSIQGLVNSWEAANELNTAIETALCPALSVHDAPFAPFRREARVMQMENDYANDVFNGEVGHVTGLTPLTVDFDQRQVQYSAERATKLRLAYFVPVHKFQGNECGGLIYYVRPWDTRRLFYTAVTRVKGPESRILLMTEPGTIDRVLSEENREPERHTLLPEMLY